MSKRKTELQESQSRSGTWCSQTRDRARRLRVEKRAPRRRHLHPTSRHAPPLPVRPGYWNPNTASRKTWRIRKGQLPRADRSATSGESAMRRDIHGTTSAQAGNPVIQPSSQPGAANSDAAEDGELGTHTEHPQWGHGGGATISEKQFLDWRIPAYPCGFECSYPALNTHSLDGKYPPGRVQSVRRAAQTRLCLLSPLQDAGPQRRSRSQIRP